jgi:hypothetical protein
MIQSPARSTTRAHREPKRTAWFDLNLAHPSVAQNTAIKDVATKPAIVQRGVGHHKDLPYRCGSPSSRTSRISQALEEKNASVNRYTLRRANFSCIIFAPRYVLRIAEQDFRRPSSVSGVRMVLVRRPEAIVRTSCPTLAVCSRLKKSPLSQPDFRPPSSSTAPKFTFNHMQNSRQGRSVWRRTSFRLGMNRKSSSA